MKCCIFGASEIGTACAIYLYEAGNMILLIELPETRARCRLKSFAEVCYVNEFVVEEVTARRCRRYEEVSKALEEGYIPLVAELEPESIIDRFSPEITINTTRTSILANNLINMKVGVAGVDCRAIIQHCGRKAGSLVEIPEVTEPDIVGGYSDERYITAEQYGRFFSMCGIGERVVAGAVLGYIENDEKEIQSAGKTHSLTIGRIEHPISVECTKRIEVKSKISGVLAGIVGNIVVEPLTIIAEVDPLCDTELCYMLSGNCRCIAGSVLREFLKVKRNEEREYIAK